MPVSSACQLIDLYHFADWFMISNVSTYILLDLQLCANQDTSEEETTNDGRCRVVCDHSYVLLCVPDALVRAFFC
jgi:hypothetical protein